MSHHKKRVYPQAQLQYGQNATPLQQPAQFMPPQDPAAAGMSYGQMGMPPQGAVPSMGQQQFLTHAQEQLHQQIDQATTSMNDMHLHNVPLVDPNAYMQPQVPVQMGTPLQQQQQPMAAPAYGQPSAAMGQNMRPMNQLYPIDLLTELPPPITDLTLPPPPLVIPPERMLVPSELSNASPDYIRSTLNAVPKNSSLLKKSKLPFGLVIRPYQHLYDDIDPPPLNEDGLIVRCRRCRSYMNPFVTFIEQGRRWRCNFCRLANDVPMQMDQSDPNDPKSRYDRNEIKCAVMEYMAPKEYTLRQPPPATYCFLIDVSQSSIKSGLLATTINTLLQNLDSIPNHDERTRISILCVDNAIHYFKIPLDSENNEESADQINMMDIADLEEPFLPRPNSMVVSLKACRQNIETLLTKIPQIFQSNLITNFALGPALKSAYHLIGGVGGKIIVVSGTLPNLGIGKLQRRNESGVVNTSKETAQLLSCQDSFYKNFTIDCSKVQITVDLFLASEDYMDVASLSNLSRFTAGQTHFYPGFSGKNPNDIVKFSTEFAKHISMDFCMETVMRARGSTGLRMSRFYGHFFNRSSDLCAFSTMPRDQSYLFEVNVDESIMADYCYVQVAVLLSLNNSQRRIRIITLAMPTTESLAEVYASADQLAIASFYNSKAVEKALNSSLDDARVLINKSVQDILATYKKEIVVSNTAGGAPLRLCANLRMFPLLMHSLTKHMAFRSGIVPSDHRASALNNLESLPLKYLIKNIYPDVYSLHDMADEAGLPVQTEDGEATGTIVLPQPINATSSLFERYGLYLIDNGNELFLWMGGDAVPALVFDVFGTQDIFDIPIGKQEIPVVENSEFNQRVRNIINQLRNHDDVITYQSLYIVRGASLSEPVNHASAREVATLRLWASSTLVEDKILNNESYREFLQIMKARISK
ncbi:BBF_HP2_G0026450.mRNA.1.CDS.1 [Saccharomyces cerevisiae]|nr:BBF_HP2_G0026450.mRNA.1.CDS.1 [Saccharomyces cerevisiae]CAI6458676.1 BBF_HP2_G0026450.mRNA.1.CDS.1 [Saccharomyces cerevisiae]CAI6458965.1 BBF_HP1_G0026660.mRNA.1.CDS.1 [Saccharomyces cerevisiae]CAI7089817.1 BBF_collapsed_G0026990.mRNA.1.CDS.1 [Saccharomyces cerevisiae]